MVKVSSRVASLASRLTIFPESGASYRTPSYIPRPGIQPSTIHPRQSRPDAFPSPAAFHKVIRRSAPLPPALFQIASRILALLTFPTTLFPALQSVKRVIRRHSIEHPFARLPGRSANSTSFFLTTLPPLLFPPRECTALRGIPAVPLPITPPFRTASIVSIIHPPYPGWHVRQPIPNTGIQQTTILRQFMPHSRHEAAFQPFSLLPIYCPGRPSLIIIEPVTGLAQRRDYLLESYPLFWSRLYSRNLPTFPHSTAIHRRLYRYRYHPIHANYYLCILRPSRQPYCKPLGLSHQPLAPYPVIPTRTSPLLAAFSLVYQADVYKPRLVSGSFASEPSTQVVRRLISRQDVTTVPTGIVILASGLRLPPLHEAVPPAAVCLRRLPSSDALRLGISIQRPYRYKAVHRVELISRRLFSVLHDLACILSFMPAAPADVRSNVLIPEGGELSSIPTSSTARFPRAMQCWKTEPSPLHTFFLSSSAIRHISRTIIQAYTGITPLGITLIEPTFLSSAVMFEPSYKSAIIEEPTYIAVTIEIEARL